MCGLIRISNSPAVPGLVFRHFCGASDYAGMAAVLTASEMADGLARQVSVEQITAAYQHLSNCDPYQDMILAEINGKLVGYGRGWWWEDTAGRLFGMSAFIVPEQRRKGIGTALQQWLEERMQQIAAEDPYAGPQSYQVDVKDYQDGKKRLLEKAGYQPVRYFYEMVRSNLEQIPDWPLPEGVELRPVLPEHYRAIWKAVGDTIQEEWGQPFLGEKEYKEWLDDEHFQPELWQVAWDPATERVVGHVLTFIDQRQNQQMNRLRGFTEGIGVIRSWRRRGLAKALITRSLQAQKAAGMAESALVVDGENRNATRLYEQCGFRVVSWSAIYRKGLAK